MLLRKVTLLICLLVSLLSSANAEAVKLKLDELDKTAFLLGMADMPRLESNHEALNKAFSYFVFKDRVTAETFIDIAKSTGIDDIELFEPSHFIDEAVITENGGVGEPVYFVSSAELSKRFQPLIQYTKVGEYAEQYESVKALSLARYSIPLYAQAQKEKSAPDEMIASIDKRAYPNLPAMNALQLKGFVLGLLAARATTDKKIRREISSGGAEAQYGLMYLRLLESFSEQLDGVFLAGGIRTLGMHANGISYGSDAVVAIGWVFNLSPEVQDSVEPLIKAREATAEAELEKAGASGYDRNVYKTFTY